MLPAEEKRPRGPQSERDHSVPPTLSRTSRPAIPAGFVQPLLLDQLLILARVAIDLVELQEKAEDPVSLDEAQIAAVVLRDYGDRKLRELRLHSAQLSAEGIALYFETGKRGQVTSWSLKLALEGREWDP